MFSRLSWDLFIFVFFGIVAAYSFIIGRKGTTKIILATYVSILTADGIGNFLNSQVAKSEALQKLVAFAGFNGGMAQFTAFTKIAIFIMIIVLISKIGAFDVEVRENTGFARFSVNLLLAVFSGGLILSAVIVFANGGSLISGAGTISPDFLVVYNQSKLVKFMLDWHNFWFAAPGFIFVVTSIWSRRQSN